MCVAWFSCGAAVVDSSVEQAEGVRLTITTDTAMTWRGLKLAFLLILSFSALITAYFVAIGAWMVLPFAGLEMLVLGVGFYLSACCGLRREEIELRRDRIRVRSGAHRLESECELARHWTRVILQQDPSGWYPSRLWLRAHGVAIEIGRRLSEDERRALAAELKRHIDTGRGLSAAL